MKREIIVPTFIESITIPMMRLWTKKNPNFCLFFSIVPNMREIFRETKGIEDKYIYSPNLLDEGSIFILMIVGRHKHTIV